MSLLLSTTQLDRMRATAERAFPDVCDIERRQEVSDGGGGTTTVWNEHLANVPCRLSPVGGGEIGLTGARIEDEATSLITVAHDVDVLESDRILINGFVYDVQLVRRRGEWALTTRIECKEADQ